MNQNKDLPENQNSGVDSVKSKISLGTTKEEIKLIIDWLEDYYQMELYADTKKLPSLVNKLKEVSDEV